MALKWMTEKWILVRVPICVLGFWETMCFINACNACCWISDESIQFKANVKTKMFKHCFSRSKIECTYHFQTISCPLKLRNNYYITGFLYHYSVKQLLWSQNIPIHWTIEEMVFYWTKTLQVQVICIVLHTRYTVVPQRNFQALLLLWNLWKGSLI